MMQRTDFTAMPCSIARTLAVVGEPWTPLILRDITFGLTRFDELQRDLGVATNVLTDRLNTLVARGLVSREPYQTRPLRHRYQLTEAGAELLPVLLALLAWGDKWAGDGHGAPVTIVHRDCGQPTEGLLVCSVCKRPLATGNVAARTGPGGQRGPGAYLLPGFLDAPGRPEAQRTAPPASITGGGRYLPTQRQVE